VYAPESDSCFVAGVIVSINGHEVALGDELRLRTGLESALLLRDAIGVEAPAVSSFDQKILKAATREGIGA
jgi:hypothetical protein